MHCGSMALTELLKDISLNSNRQCLTDELLKLVRWYVVRLAKFSRV